MSKTKIGVRIKAPHADFLIERTVEDVKAEIKKGVKSLLRRSRGLQGMDPTNLETKKRVRDLVNSLRNRWEFKTTYGTYLKKEKRKKNDRYL